MTYSIYHELRLTTQPIRLYRIWFFLLFGLTLLLGQARPGFAATYSLATSASSLQSGQAVSVSWTALAGNAKDWIGWYRVGDPNSVWDSNRWIYTGGAASGVFTPTAPTTPGTYEFRYLLNNGFSDSARSQTVTVAAPASSYSLTSSAVSVQAGQSISVNWNSSAGSAKDWIGLYKTGDPNTSFDSSRWQYTNGAASGTFTVTAPATAGVYEFRYLLNNGFTSAAASPSITVTSGAVSTAAIATTSSYSLVGNTVTVQAGQTLSATWTSPSGSSKDWISLYKIGDPNTAYDRNRWRYTNGAGAGTFATTAPTAPGNYEFRYLTNDGFTSTARSQTISVGSSTVVTAATTTYTLTPSSSAATTGQSISVNWTSPGGVGNDWIALFKTGDPNSAYDSTRWRYTNGAGAGTFTTTTPNTAGNYEFRYLPGGTYTDVARSTTIAVSLGGPTVALTANPGSVTAGQFARLSWSSTNAGSCAASGGWSGNKAVFGSEDVAPNTTTTYNLTCSGAGGTASQNTSVIVSSGAAGGSFYVATNGDDGNPGTETAPFKNLKRAMSVLRAGDTLWVRGGEYDTAVGVTGALSDSGGSIIPSGGSWDNPVTIKAYPGEKPVFRRYLPAGYPYTEDEVRNSIHLPTYEECAQYASYGLISNFPYSCWQGSGNNQPVNGLFWQAPKGYVAGYVVDMLNIRIPVQYVIFDGIDIDAKGIVANPIGFSDFSKHIRFQNLEIRYGIGSCISQVANDPTVDMDLQFINSKIHSCGVPYDTNMVGGGLARKSLWAKFWHGWYLHAGGASFINSESFNHAGTGLSPDGNNIVVRNSKIYDNTSVGIYIGGGDNWLIENNVFYNNAYLEVYHYGGKSHTIRNNTIVASPKNSYPVTGVASAGIFLGNGSYSSVYENNIIDGFRYGVYNQSGMFTPNIVRNNLLRTNPAGSEIFNIGSNPMTLSGNILNRDPLFINPANGDYRLQGGSPAIGAATDGGNIGAR